MINQEGASRLAWAESMSRYARPSARASVVPVRMKEAGQSVAPYYRSRAGPASLARPSMVPSRLSPPARAECCHWSLNVV